MKTRIYAAPVVKWLKHNITSSIKSSVLECAILMCTLYVPLQPEYMKWNEMK